MAPLWKHAQGMDSSARAEPFPPRMGRRPALEAAERRALMARWLALLFGAGACLSLALFFALPHPEADMPSLLAVIGAAFALTACVGLWGERIPDTTYPWL